jgi:hypothetical protein
VFLCGGHWWIGISSHHDYKQIMILHVSLSPPTEAIKHGGIPAANLRSSSMKICLFYFIYILNLNRNFYKVLFLTLIKKKKTHYSGRKKETTTSVFVAI